MRVNERQVRKIIMSPSVLLDDTNLDLVWSEDIALDLLDARKLIKEMREVLEQTRKYLPQVSSLPRIETEQGNCVKALVTILDRTKDYS